MDGWDADHYALWSSSALQVKLGLVVAVAALAALHIRFPRVHALQALILIGSLAIVALGVDLGG